MAEVMVAAGVAGTLALGTLQLTSLHTRATLTEDLVSAQQTVQQLLRNSAACTQTLAGINVNAFAPFNGTALPTPINLPGGIKKSDGTASLPISPSAASITTANENGVDKSSNFVVYGSTVMVKSMAITSVRTTGGENKEELNDSAALKQAAVGEITIEFAIKDSTRPAGTKIRFSNKHVLVPLTLNSSGVIVDCTTPEDIGVQETEKELCEDFGGDMVAGRCAGATEELTDTVKQKFCNDIKGSFYNGNNSCTAPWIGCRCTGSYVRGFDPASGKPICNNLAPPTGCVVP